MREFLEKKYEEGMDAEKTVRVGIETLLEVVENAKNIEICIVHPNNKIVMLDEDKLKEIADQINKEKEAAEEAKKNKKKD